MRQASLHGHAWSAPPVAADLFRCNLADVDFPGRVRTNFGLTDGLCDGVDF